MPRQTSVIDPRISGALRAAQGLIAEALVTAVTDTAALLLEHMRSAASYHERGQFASAQSQLLKYRDTLQKAFAAALPEKIEADLDSKNQEQKARDPTDWDALSLVEPDQIEERISFERIGHFISHECEAELRDLNAYMSTMLGHPWADPERNPLRGNVIGSALHSAIESITEEAATQKILSTELGQALAKALSPCYRSIIDDLNARGFRQADLSVRSTPSGMPAGGGGGPGGPATADDLRSRWESSADPSAAGGDSRLDEARGRWERSMLGRPAGGDDPRYEEARSRWERSMLGRPAVGDDPRYEEARARWERSMLGRPAASDDPRMEEARSRWERSGGRVGAGDDPRLEDARRRWERSLQGRPPGADPADSLRSWESSIHGRYGNIDPLSQEYESDSAAALLDRLVRGGMPSSGGGWVPLPPPPSSPQADAELMGLLRRINGEAIRSGPGSLSGALTPAAPTNIIRAHREELMEASQGKLDHLLIEVVSNIFDQILSDARVSPQMALQIARLQLPVLRVALRDPSFFSSRRHPVRRFVNRVSALGLGIDDFENGTGKELLVRINKLVSEIVDGDFDQIDLYDAKLIDLEEFTAEQLRAEVKASPAGETLEAKEIEWLQQHHFILRLRAALDPISLPAYLKEFLGRVWGQVILAASQGEGADSALARQFRRAGYDLVVSIQPKRTLKQRMDFISSLPALMAVLNKGMALIEWPEESRSEFLGKMVSDHAGSLKATPASELDYNMLLRKLEAAFRTPIPNRDEVEEEPAPPEAFAHLSAQGDSPVDGEVAAPIVEQRFSAEEAKKVGLIAEDAVDWSKAVVGDVPSPVDLDLAALGAVEEGGDPSVLVAQAESSGLLAAVPGENIEPTEGPQLRHHLQIGTSYQLQLKDQWEKVRLTYMSPARNLFLFTYGTKDRQSISMTSRMLERLCEARRMRAYEAASLIDRATAQVQRHLAAMKVAAVPPEPTTT